jgi:hypothetical protein
VSTVIDLARFDAALDGDVRLTPRLKALMWTPIVSTGGDTLPYGLGWFVQTYQGEKVVWHYGHWSPTHAGLFS